MNPSKKGTSVESINHPTGGDRRKISLRKKHFALFFFSPGKSVLPSNAKLRIFWKCHFPMLLEKIHRHFCSGRRVSEAGRRSFDFPGSTLSTSLFGGNGLPDFFTVFFSHMQKRVEKISCKMGPNIYYGL